MNKRYLLISGLQYYPSRGTGDWYGTYDTEEEALKVALSLKTDWYDIIDLWDWQ